MNPRALYVFDAFLLIEIGHDHELSRLRVHIQQGIIRHTVSVLCHCNVPSDSLDCSIPHQFSYSRSIQGAHQCVVG